MSAIKSGMVTKTTKSTLENLEQEQRLIDVFVNSVHVYDDKAVVLLNYRDGDKCVHFTDFDENKKAGRS